MGRWAILLTKKVVEEKFEGDVIYGDTDSVFCVFRKVENQPGKTRKEILQDIIVLCHVACDYISSLLPNPMKLEFEKAFDKFLLIKKKQ